MVEVEHFVDIIITNEDGSRSKFRWTIDEARAIKDALIPIVGAGPPPPSRSQVKKPAEPYEYMDGNGLA